MTGKIMADGQATGVPGSVGKVVLPWREIVDRCVLELDLGRDPYRYAAEKSIRSAIRAAVAEERAEWVRLARAHCVRCCEQIVTLASLGEVQPMVSQSSAQAMVAEEREACAALAEKMYHDNSGDADCFPEIHAAIRSRT